MRDIDQIIRDMSVRSSNPIGLVDAGMFVVGMRKLATEGPDTTGAIEGPFTVPLAQAVELIGQIVANEFKTQVYYIYYANMLRGLSHHSIAEEFLDHAQDELEHATYLLRRMSVLSPGGISIPPYPPPEPLTDPVEVIKKMIVVEQMGLALWKALHSIMGDNPMKYTIEQYLQAEEEHQDELWQLLDATPMPEAPTAESVQDPQGDTPAEPEQTTSVKVDTMLPSGAKVAGILMSAMQRKLAAVATYEQLRRAGMDPSYDKKEKKSADLTPQARAQVADTNFVFPKERRYPIHDKDHALAALGMVAMHGSDSEKSKVRSAVAAKYPGLVDKKASFTDVQKAMIRAKLEADAKHRREQRHEFSDKNVTSLTDLVLKSKVSNFGMPVPPTMETPEGYVAHEKELAAQQAMAEASHSRTVAMQASQAAQQAQAEAQAAQEQLQQAQAQVDQLSQQVAQGSQQEMMATQQAAEAEARAADHSISKMQLGMRINQMRQELANLVMQDPVSESAATVSDLAVQGQPATPMQQAQAEQAAAGQDPNAPPSAETQEQVEEAQSAQQNAEEQTAEAEQAQAKDQAKAQGGGPGTHVTVKTSNEMGTVVQKLRPKAGVSGAVGEVAKPAQGVLGSLVQKARPYAPHIAAGLGGAALLGGGVALARHARNVQQEKAAGVVDNASRAAGKAFATGAGEAIAEGAKKHAPALALGALGVGGLAAAHHSSERSRRREDIARGVAEGVHRAKVSSSADRRLARAILDGPDDTLGRSLIKIVKKHTPGAAAQASAEKAVQEGVKSVKDVDLSGLGEKLRPHLPGFGVGLGAGILGSKMLSRKEDQPPPYGYIT